MSTQRKSLRPEDVLEYWHRSLLDKARATLWFDGKDVVTLRIEDLRRDDAASDRLRKCAGHRRLWRLVGRGSCCNRWSGGDGQCAQRTAGLRNAGRAILDAVFLTCHRAAMKWSVLPFLGADPVETKALQAAVRSAVARGCVVHIVTRPASRLVNTRLQVLLRDMGATVHHIALLHSKTLIMPTVLIEGSFNWLSVKRANPEGANLDTSWRLIGQPARMAATDAIKELRARGAVVNMAMIAGGAGRDAQTGGRNTLEVLNYKLAFEIHNNQIDNEYQYHLKILLHCGEKTIAL